MRKVAKVAAIALGVVLLLVCGYTVYALATANGRLVIADAPYPQITASNDPKVIERGRYLVHGPAHCESCHGGLDAKGIPDITKPEVPLAGGYVFALGPIGTTYAPNLTPDAETGIGKRTDAELARTIRTGVQHDGTWSMFMRFSASQLSDDDLVAVISYLRSAPAVSHAVPRGLWKLFGKLMLPMFPINARPITGPKGVAPAKEPTLEQGDYLANRVALCAGCHTNYDRKTFEPSGPTAAGGAVDPSHGAEDSDMEYQPPNLTSDPSGMTGRLDEDAFIGRLRGGRAYQSSIMPWESFGRMTDVDLRSIYRYLKSLPPVHNDLGPSYRKKGWKPGN